MKKQNTQNKPAFNQRHTSNDCRTIRQSFYFETSKLVLALIVIGSFGCQRPKKDSAVSDSVPAAVTKTEKSACDAMLEAIEKDSNFKTAEPKAVNVKRQFQRTIRKNCSGNIKSDKIETVQSPTFKISLSPLLDRPFKAVLAYNQPTCDHKLTAMPASTSGFLDGFYAVFGDGKKMIHINGDLAETWLNFKFDAGENKLYVRYFYDCSPQNFAGNRRVVVGESNCAESNDYQTVLYPLTVNYAEETLDGSRTIEASKYECEQELKEKVKTK